MVYEKWLDEKPEFEKNNTECAFVTACMFNKIWEYSAWSTMLLLGEDESGEPAYYLGLLDEYGEEWGALEDLKADKYYILPKI